MVMNKKIMFYSLLIIGCFLFVIFIVFGLILSIKIIKNIGFFLALFFLFLFQKYKKEIAYNAKNLKYFLLGFVNALIILLLLFSSVLYYDLAKIVIFLPILFIIQIYLIFTRNNSYRRDLKLMGFGMVIGILSFAFCLYTMYFISPVDTQMGIFLPISIAIEELKEYLF